MRYGWLALLLVMGSVLAAQSIPSQNKGSEGMVSGTVTDATGAVIEGAELVFRSEAVTEQGVTNPDGRYHAVLPSGTYQVTVRSRFFVDLNLDALRVREGDPQWWDVMLYLSPATGDHPYDIPANQTAVPAEGFLIPTPQGVRTIFIWYDQRSQKATSVGYSCQPTPAVLASTSTLRWRSRKSCSIVRNETCMVESS